MRRRIVWLPVGLLLAAALVLSSCAGDTADEDTGDAATGDADVAVDTGEIPAGWARDAFGVLKEVPRYGGVPRYSWAGVGAVGSWDPGATEGGMTWHLTMYQLLTGSDATLGASGTREYADNGGFLPGKYRSGVLAESWETPDLETVIIHLRQGVYFHDKPPANGREMVAADVVASFDRTQNLPRSYWYKAEGAERIEVTEIDKYTVEIKLVEPDAWPIGGLSSTLIYPVEAAEEFGDLEDWRNAQGTGAWIATDYVPDSSLTFVRNDNYWEYDPFWPDNKLPYTDGYTVVQVADTNMGLAALRTGKLDWLTGINWEDAQELRKTNPELLSSRGYNYYTPVIDMRTDTEPFSDINVRKALSMAIDRRAMVTDLYAGNAALLAWPWTPDLTDIWVPLEEMSEDIQEIWSYDPDKARELLADAGFPDGMKLEMIVPNDRIYVDLASIIKMFWDEIGVDLDLRVLEIGTFYGRLMAKQYDQVALTHNTSTNPYFFYSVNYQSEDGVVGLYNNSMVVDEYINDTGDLLIVTEDLDERDEIFRGIAPYILENVWNIPLPLTNMYVFWQPWLKGYDGGWFGDGGRWIDEDLKAAR